MLCCAVCGTSVGRGARASQCSRGVMYQVWGQQGVIPPRFRLCWRYHLDDHYEALSLGKRGFEDFRAVCCACHLAADFHLNRTQFIATACAKCRAAVDGGFRNVRHRERCVALT